MGTLLLLFGLAGLIAVLVGWNDPECKYKK
jgi:hypothetical protein